MRSLNKAYVCMTPFCQNGYLMIKINLKNRIFTIIKKASLPGLWWVSTWFATADKEKLFCSACAREQMFVRLFF